MSTDDERRSLFNVVYRSCYHDVVAYAVRRCRNATIATEVAADTFVVVWRRLDDMPGGEQTRPWVFGVARGVFANAARGRRRRDRLDARIASAARSTPISVANDDDGRVELALARLSPNDAELLRLAYWEDLGPSDLSVALELGASTVRSQLSRARDRFRVQYEQIGDELRSDDAVAGQVSGGGRLPASDCER